MKLEENILEEKTLFEGRVIKVKNRKVLLPDGKTATRDIVQHPGAVAILAFKDEDTILLVEQYRSALEKIILEVPAGKIDKGEKIETCAKRELEEETGFKSDNIKYMGKIVTSPGFADEYVYIFKAENLYKGNNNLKDEDEFINLKEMKITELKDMVSKGNIIDGKTIAALYFYDINKNQ